jgi:hypothetical protein
MLKAGITSASQTITSSRKLVDKGAAIDITKQQASLDQQFLKKLQTLGKSMTPSECASLHEALGDDPMPYTGTGLLAILDELNSIQFNATEAMCQPKGSKRRKTKAAAASGAAVAREIHVEFDAQHGQDLTRGLARSLTKIEWSVLYDKSKVIGEKYEAITNRFRRLGIKVASQQTRKWVAAVLSLVAVAAFRATN